MNFKPYADKIIVKPIKKEKTDGGIVIPETADMVQLMKAEVVAVSDGFLFGDKEWPVTSKVGDIVWFQRGLGILFPFEGEEYLILQDGVVFGKETIQKTPREIVTEKMNKVGRSIDPEEEIVIREEAEPEGRMLSKDDPDYDPLLQGNSI